MTHMVNESLRKRVVKHDPLTKLEQERNLLRNTIDKLSARLEDVERTIEKLRS